MCVAKTPVETIPAINLPALGVFFSGCLNASLRASLPAFAALGSPPSNQKVPTVAAAVAVP